MTLGALLVAVLVAVVIGLLVVLVGSIFDKTPNNRWAWLAGGIVALIVFLVRIGLFGTTL